MLSRVLQRNITSKTCIYTQKESYYKKLLPATVETDKSQDLQSELAKWNPFSGKTIRQDDFSLTQRGVSAFFVSLGLQLIR